MLPYFKKNVKSLFCWFSLSCHFRYNKFTWMFGFAHILPCKATRQYLLTLQVSRNCLLSSEQYTCIERFVQPWVTLRYWRRYVREVSVTNSPKTAPMTYITSSKTAGSGIHHGVQHSNTCFIFYTTSSWPRRYNTKTSLALTERITQKGMYTHEIY